MRLPAWRRDCDDAAMAPRRVALFAVVLVALGVGVAALAGGLQPDEGLTPQTSSPKTAVADAPPSDAGLVAEVEKPRYLATRPMLQVIRRNAGTSPAQVERLQLVTPGFAPRTPTVRDATLPPGRRVDIPIAYGRARCDASAAASPDEPLIMVQVRGEESEVRELRVPLPQPNETLDRLQDIACRQRAVRQGLDLGFGGPWTAGEAAGDATVRGSLVIRRRGSDEPVTVGAVGSNVNFTLRAAAEPPAPLVRMDPATRSARVPVEITASRCDAHAMADSKKMFLFPVWVTLGDDPEQYLEISPEGRGRRMLEELIQACVAGRDGG